MNAAGDIVVIIGDDGNSLTVVEPEVVADIAVDGRALDPNLPRMLSQFRLIYHLQLLSGSQ